MSYKILSISPFDKQLKKLTKRYPSFKEEFITFTNKLKDEPFTGVHLGKNCFKIRLKIKSKSRGKSGGARLITHVHIKDNIVYLLSIYDKSETNNLTNQEITELLSLID